MALIKCPDCGKEISDSSISCMHCGRPMKDTNAQIQTVFSQNNTSETDAICALGIFLPFIGIPVYLGMSDKNSKKAKDLKVGSIIGTCVYVVVILIIASLF